MCLKMRFIEIYHQSYNPWRYRECQYVGSMGPADSPETVDLTAEDGPDLFSDLYDEEAGNKDVM